MVCHVNPTGGGLRNDYGSNVVALEELPFKRWQAKGDEDWDGTIGDHLQVGGDFRVQGIQYGNTADTTRKSAVFPMQAEVYTYLELHENAGMFTKLSAKNSETEFWGLFKVLPQNGWIRVGQTLPNYGIRLDDHTSFFRYGNMSKTAVGLNYQEGFQLFWSKKSSLIEFGLPFGNGFLFTASGGTPLNTGSQEMKNFTSQLYFARSFEKFAPMFSVNLMKEDNLSLVGIAGGISFSKFTWTFELDKAENLIDGKNSYAYYDELAWEIKQGIHLITKYDFFDPDEKLLTGAISRYTLGVELFPLNVLEVKIQARLSEVDKNGFIQPDPEYLVQFHTWF
ncbi:uncharacterized protein METZ01_LOCUS64520 [marine metagenome]|uniref:Alginate export domain-containing protein n=1 Tax=marine metagenome TaxID=408172 RepID=A0A381T646_9ZZZZ